jgi:hypothetical protein
MGDVSSTDRRVSNSDNHITNRAPLLAAGTDCAACSPRKRGYYGCRAGKPYAVLGSLTRATTSVAPSRFDGYRCIALRHDGEETRATSIFMPVPYRQRLFAEHSQVRGKRYTPLLWKPRPAPV